MAQNYNIKITGSGTIEEIRNALAKVSEDLFYFNQLADAEGSAEWEDPTLMTEISTDESEEEEEPAAGGFYAANKKG